MVFTVSLFISMDSIVTGLRVVLASIEAMALLYASPIRGFWSWVCWMVWVNMVASVWVVMVWFVVSMVKDWAVSSPSTRALSRLKVR